MVTLALARDAQSRANNMEEESEPMSKKLTSSNGTKTPEEKQRDNRANQMNPNNERYRKAREKPQPSSKKGSE